MEIANETEVFYSLCIQDIQDVAIQEIECELSADEVNRITDKIAERINWYDAMSLSRKSGVFLRAYPP